MNQLVDNFGGDDLVGLWEFSADPGGGNGPDYKSLVPIGRMNGVTSGLTHRQLLLNSVANGLTTGGETGLYNTIEAAVKSVREHYDPTRSTRSCC
jgi:Ca-activated chloride channel homolog